LTLSEIGDVTDITQFPDWASVIDHPDVVPLGSDVQSMESGSTQLDVTIEQPLYVDVTSWSSTNSFGLSNLISNTNGRTIIRIKVSNNGGSFEEDANVSINRQT
jgi:hypothetical protein